MAKIDDVIKKIQDLPYASRVKIMWVAVTVIGLIVVLLWILNLKSTIKNLNTDDTSKASSAPTTQTSSNYVSVERIEATTSSFKIFINFNNPTDDILNIPQVSDISLTVNNQTFHANQITDRQGQPFVQKILSHTQNFGILMFSRNDGDTGELDINQMFFELSPNEILNQVIKLDFKKLETKSSLRN